jgi:hypothetical protein
MAEIRYFPGGASRPVRQNVVPKLAPPEQPAANTEKYCVYNVTRECFVATEVEALDGSDDNVEAILRSLSPGDGKALWIAPFIKIARTSVRFPLDLVILDKDCVVLDTVESFPMSGPSVPGSQPASVLVFQADTLAQVETQIGDQLAIAAPKEMKKYLEQLRQAEMAAQDAAFAPSFGDGSETAAEAPTERSQAETPQSAIGAQENLSSDVPAAATPKLPEAENPAVSPGKQARPWEKDKPRGWFMRLLAGDTPDPRAALRQSVPGLIAYFFTGGAPKEHPVRDISRTGLYIVTDERWYMGTVVRITLTDRHKPTAEYSITVNAKVVRLGSDGVGMEFILAGEGHRHGKSFELTDQSNGVDSAQIEEFLRRLIAK